MAAISSSGSLPQAGQPSSPVTVLIDVWRERWLRFEQKAVSMTIYRRKDGAEVQLLRRGRIIDQLFLQIGHTEVCQIKDMSAVLSLERTLGSTDGLTLLLTTERRLRIAPFDPIDGWLPEDCDWCLGGRPLGGCPPGGPAYPSKPYALSGEDVPGPEGQPGLVDIVLPPSSADGSRQSLYQALPGRNGTH